MSKTLFVEYRGTGFWAYDVAVGILLKHLIDAANKAGPARDAAWLTECVESWRANAVSSDFGLHLHDAWNGDQVEVICSLLAVACASLECRECISADEMAAWNIIDGRGVFARGDPWFPTAPVVELAEAVESLLAGTLPAAPVGTWWIYGTRTGRSTIERRN